MKRLYVLLIAGAFVGILRAQTGNIKVKDGWKYKGTVGINFSQTSLTNWSAGGDNTLAGNALFNGNANYTKGHWLWQNTLVLEYGLAKMSGSGTQKSTDKLEFTTQLGYTTNNVWYYSAMADFKSQFAKGYNYPNKEHYISKFMAPAYTNVSLGMEYKPVGKWYSAYFSPVAGKLTFVQDTYLSDLGLFGVDKGKKFKGEFGAYVKGRAEKIIWENVKFITDATFFSAYNNSFGNIDVEWNMLINMKINKFLNASINTTLKYDDNVKYIDKEGGVHGARIQFKEVIGIGLGYNF